MSAYIPVPTLGMLPASAYLIRGEQPILVDTGILSLGDSYFDQIAELIEPGDLCWIWLTHLDPDHLGCLARLLDEAPAARVVTNFLGMGKLNLVRPVAPERFYLINPGQILDAGDRQLLALRPPTYDAPETLAAFDGTSRSLFSSDAFGGLTAKPADTAADLTMAELREGIVSWTAIDVPWISRVAAEDLERSLAAIVDLDAEIVLSSHLPPAAGLMPALAEAVAAARSAQPFVGPDQSALSQILAGGPGATPAP